MKRIVYLLVSMMVVCLCCVFAAGVEAETQNDSKQHTVSVAIPEALKLRLSTTAVEFTQADLAGYPPNNFPYYSGSKQITVYIHYNKGATWALRVSGGDFTSAQNHTLAASVLEWSTTGEAGTFTGMSSSPQEVVQGTKTTGWQQQNIYYRLKLDGSEYGGETYTTTITYTLVTL